MGLFNIFGKKTKPSWKEYIDKHENIYELLTAARRAFWIHWDNNKNNVVVETSNQGYWCLRVVHPEDGKNLGKLYKNEMIDAFYLLERACDCGSGMAAIYLALLYERGIGTPPPGRTADTYYQLAFINSDSGADVAEFVMELQSCMDPFAISTDTFEESFAMDLAFAIMSKGTLYDKTKDLIDICFAKAKNCLQPKEYALLRWISGVLVCWHASQGKLMSCAFLCNFLHTYDMPGELRLTTSFWDFFGSENNRQKKAESLFINHILPHKNSDDLDYYACLNLFDLNPDS